MIAGLALLLALAGFGMLIALLVLAGVSTPTVIIVALIVVIVALLISIVWYAESTFRGF
jgi:predicted anti-sigma-YlaC factor YlaD